MSAVESSTARIGITPQLESVALIVVPSKVPTIRGHRFSMGTPNRTVGNGWSWNVLRALRALGPARSGFPVREPTTAGLSHKTGHPLDVGHLAGRVAEVEFGHVAVQVDTRRGGASRRATASAARSSSRLGWWYVAAHVLAILWLTAWWLANSGPTACTG